MAIKLLPLVFRDDTEREFWGRVYSSELAANNVKAIPGSTVDLFADNAVIAMRMRQKFAQIPQPPNERFPTEHTARGCAACGELAPYENRVHGEIKHAVGCLLG